MPAAAVIPALIAYIKVVAVKKLVVGSRGGIEKGVEVGGLWGSRGQPRGFRDLSFLLQQAWSATFAGGAHRPAHPRKSLLDTHLCPSLGGGSRVGKDGEEGATPPPPFSRLEF